MSLPSSASVTTDALSHYPHVANYCILSRDVTPAQEEAVHAVLAITPIWYGIIIDPVDAPLAYRFATMVMTVHDLAAAKTLAAQLYETAEGHPSRSIIVGPSDPNILIGCYADREAPIPC